MASQQIFEKRIFTPSSFLKAMDDVVDHVGDLRAARRAGLMNQAFQERIMLAVTRVNGCRYCSYAHSRAAVAAGIPSTQVRELLEGELASAPETELPALLYAQHFAESEGAPDSETTRRIEALYGEKGARGIEAAIYMITMGNLLGNTFDAFLVRFKGKSAPGSTPGKEIATLTLVILSPVYLLGRRLLARG